MASSKTTPTMGVMIGTTIRLNVRRTPAPDDQGSLLEGGVHVAKRGSEEHDLHRDGRGREMRPDDAPEGINIKRRFLDERQTA